MNSLQDRLSALIRSLLLAGGGLLFQAAAQSGPPVTSVVDSFAPEGVRGFSYSGGRITPFSPPPVRPPALSTTFTPKAIS
jgi:hypothetical protein